jgi:hypothetical protein
MTCPLFDEGDDPEASDDDESHAPMLVESEPEWEEDSDGEDD